jgi:hypothetical protein
MQNLKTYERGNVCSSWQGQVVVLQVEEQHVSVVIHLKDLQQLVLYGPLVRVHGQHIPKSINTSFGNIYRLRSIVGEIIV